MSKNEELHNAAAASKASTKGYRYGEYIIPMKYFLAMDDLETVVIKLLMKAGPNGLLTDELIEQIQEEGCRCRHPATVVYRLKHTYGFMIPDATPEWRTFRGEEIKCGKYVLDYPPHHSLLPAVTQDQPTPGEELPALVATAAIPIQVDLFSPQANDAPNHEEAAI